MRLFFWALCSAWWISAATQRISSKATPNPLEPINVKVASIVPDAPGKGWMVVLAPASEKGSKLFGGLGRSKFPRKVLVIGVGDAEGTAIVFALHKKSVRRPLTHELFAKVLKAIGATVTRCVIHSYDDCTFFARLEFENNNRKLTLDCRPSDGISLALRSGGKISVLRKIFDEAGMDWPPKEGEPAKIPYEEPL
ncbi:MAG: bifunctional nuclease family protein [Elusimicrobia bacterium]|nr:bifunctional nuclease family protein [Elusimicrobiota bacterium]